MAPIYQAPTVFIGAPFLRASLAARGRARGERKTSKTSQSRTHRDVTSVHRYDKSSFRMRNENAYRIALFVRETSKPFVRYRVVPRPLDIDDVASRCRLLNDPDERRTSKQFKKENERKKNQTFVSTKRHSRAMLLKIDVIK